MLFALLRLSKELQLDILFHSYYWPVPDRLTTWGEEPALKFKVRFPLIAPAVTGLNSTPKVQVPFAGILVPHGEAPPEV